MAKHEGPYAILKRVIEEWNALPAKERDQLVKSSLDGFTTQGWLTDGLPGDFDKFIRERNAKHQEEEKLEKGEKR